MPTQAMRPHDWASAATLIAAIGALAAGFTGHLVWASLAAALVGGSACVARRASLAHPGPMPYAVRWVLLMPRGPNSPANLQKILAPRRGERLLEIGPGIGVYALPVARALAPDGALDVLDVQPAMLADLARRAQKAGVTNVTATPGDAARLPYPDASFDAAYLVEVLGEIPDKAMALREIRRVLRPAGRLVVGEAVLDPDIVALATLRRMAADAGFVFDGRRGPRFSYFARFRPAAEAGPCTR